MPIVSINNRRFSTASDLYSEVFEPEICIFFWKGNKAFSPRAAAKSSPALSALSGGGFPKSFWLFHPACWSRVSG